MKLWESGKPLKEAVENFTTGKDPETDMLLSRHDVITSIAHALMLGKTGLLTTEETFALLKELGIIYREILTGAFHIEKGIEDVHSQVEKLLTERIGDTGKKIHTGRSRNDQVLTDIRLFTREGLQHIAEKTKALFDMLLDLSEKNRAILMPGYTHMRVAMPSSFGLWFGSFAESLADDMVFLAAAYEINDQNPLGTAAGYGTSLPIDRGLTTGLLGFNKLCVNSVYAQGSRGKTEMAVSTALASVASTLGKLATDVCLFSGEDFGFLSLADDITTGSSIMPHKNNPDVFELIRARAGLLKTLPGNISQVAANLPSGYHRDYQLVKELYLPSFAWLKEMIDVTVIALQNIQINTAALGGDRYRKCYSVEEINRLVKQGRPFRDAYREVKQKLEKGEPLDPGKPEHTHTGSIGNPGTGLIKEKMENIYSRFDFAVSREAINNLLQKAGVKEKYHNQP